MDANDVRRSAAATSSSATTATTATTATLVYVTFQEFIFDGKLLTATSTLPYVSSARSSLLL